MVPINITHIAYNEAPLDYTVGPHQHSVHQWYCVLYGTVDTTIDGHLYHLDAEQAVLIPPNLTRAPRCRDRAPGYLHMIFENRTLQLEAIYCRPLSIPTPLRPDLHALVEELQRPGLNTDALIQALAVRLLLGLVRYGVEKVNTQDERLSPLNMRSHEELVAQVDAFMRRNLHRPLTHQIIARAVNLSPTHLARIFHQVTGTTLLKRLTDIRVEYAKSLLLESTFPIADISMQVGYRSFGHFSKVFKSQTGVSPSDYRRSRGHTWRK